MPVSYDFKNASRNTPSRRGTAGRRLRFIILLLVVAAVTAGVIMLIVPKKTKISENGENRAQSVENNGKNGQNPENTTAKDDDNTPSAVKDNDNVLPVTDAGDKNDPVLQIDNTKTDNTEVEISRGKGKVLNASSIDSSLMETLTLYSVSGVSSSKKNRPARLPVCSCTTGSLPPVSSATTGVVHSVWL